MLGIPMIMPEEEISGCFPRERLLENYVKSKRFSLQLTR
jgi:hypothetical protein